MIRSIEDRGSLALALGACLVTMSAAVAHAEIVNAERVVALARAQAPHTLAARTRVTEARGRLTTARLLATENPSIEGFTTVGETLERERELTLAVPFGLGLRRARRIDGAEAALDRDTQGAGDTERLVIGDALRAFYRALHAERRLGLARERAALAQHLHDATRQKHAAGDVARLDVNVAETELARAESAVRAEEGAGARARADLAIELGLPSLDAVVLDGKLEDRALLDRALAQDADPSNRPDVRAAERETEVERAALSLAGLTLVPDLALRMRYTEQAGRTSWQPGLAVTLPLFDQGQGARTEARARLERARIEFAARRRAATLEADAARVSYASAVAAVQALEARGVPRASETSEMAEQSYRAGKSNLATVLLVRREVLDLRREYSDRLLDAAIAAVDLAVARGSLP